MAGLTGSDCNEDLEDGALWVAVANCSRDRWEPFDWVALRHVLEGNKPFAGTEQSTMAYEMLVLDNLLVVQCSVPRLVL